MTPRIKTLCALAVGLALTASAPRDAAADGIQYSTLGSIGTATSGTPGLIYFDGVNNNNVAPPGSINLGQFVMSSLANTNDATYTNVPFNLLVYTNGSSGEMATGFVNASLGPDATANPATNGKGPWATATFTSLTPFGAGGLPFTLNLPLNTALNLNVTNGSGSAPTLLTGAVTMGVPEPSSVAVFAVALGGLGFWGRRRLAR